MDTTPFPPGRTDPSDQVSTTSGAFQSARHKRIEHTERCSLEAPYPAAGLPAAWRAEHCGDSPGRRALQKQTFSADRPQYESCRAPDPRAGDARSGRTARGSSVATVIRDATAPLGPPLRSDDLSVAIVGSRSLRAANHAVSGSRSGRRGAVPAGRCFAPEQQRGHRHAARSRLSSTGHAGRKGLAAAISKAAQSGQGPAGGRAAQRSRPSIRLGQLSELETGADAHHWRAPRMDRPDDLLDIDPL